MPFMQATIEALRWYVYLLIDPRNDVVFYVGKGWANRAYQHAAEARDRFDHPELQKAKHQRILAIEADGHAVRVEILRHALASPEEAYTVEAAAIDLLHRVHPGTLLNDVLGHHSEEHGLESADELEIHYAADPLPNPGVTIMLTSLDQAWYLGMPEEELREFTPQWWSISPSPTPWPEYVLGVHRRIVRGVYRTTGIRDRKKGDRGWQGDLTRRYPRRGFTVVPAPEMKHVIGTTVDGLLGENRQWQFRYVTDAVFAARDAARAAVP